MCSDWAGLGGLVWPGQGQTQHRGFTLPVAGWPYRERHSKLNGHNYCGSFTPAGDQSAERTVCKRRVEISSTWKGKEGSTGETAQDRRPGVPAAIESVCLSVCRMTRAIPKDLPGLPGVLVWGCGSSSRDYKRPNPHSLGGKGLWAAWCRRDLVRHYLLDAKRVASK